MTSSNPRVCKAGMTPLSCRDSIELLIDYLEHELVPQQRVVLGAHLACCDECVTYIRRYERTVHRGMDAFDCRADAIEQTVPPGLVDAIVAAVRRPDLVEG